MRLSIEELAREAGVPVRTVRYYISQGLLPGPAARGRAAAYDDEHLARLRLIRRLVEQHVPLAEQRDRLARLSGTEVERLLRDEERRGAALRRASQAAIAAGVHFGSARPGSDGSRAPCGVRAAAEF